MQKVISVALLVSLVVIPASAQDRARETMDSMIEALGGDAFMDVKDLKTTGRFFLFSKGELSGADYYTDYVKFPDMERTEFGRDKKKLSIRVNKGEEGWI